MSSKLETINSSINEIRELLNAECTSIEQLPDLVKDLVTDTSKNGFTTAFIFSSYDNPMIPPEEVVLNVDTGLVEGLEDSDWSQTQAQSASTYMLRRTSSVSNTTWMSFGIFDPSGNLLTGWSNPTNLRGIQGLPGEKGDTGEKGEPGPQGEKGDNASSHRTVMVYTTTDTETTPKSPVGGSWNLITNEVIKPESIDGCVWELNTDLLTKKSYLWMSQTTFNENGEPLGDWCTPFRMTGEKGESGADGRVIEFIYRLIPDLTTYYKLSNHLSLNKLYSKNEPDYVPEKNDSITTTKWTDSPKGISETMQLEVVCNRVRNTIEDPWGEWSPCIIWSKWGEDGQDGDGVEYIYLVTADKVEGQEITGEYVEAYFMPNLTNAMNHSNYQENDFCFNSKWGSEFAGYDWSDEPKDVGPGKPREWVSVRKKVKDSTGKSSWGKFSSPKLWARYADDGYAYLTSFVFKRHAGDTAPSQPQGGSFADPLPADKTWYDSVPAGTDPVWMSTRTFYAGDENFDSDWTAPKKLNDTNNFQVEYSADNWITGEKISKFTGDEASWRAYQKSEFGATWGDDTEVTDPVWMITATCNNGIWSDWVLCRIKGEKGDRGDNGTSVEIKGTFKLIEDIKLEWESYVKGNFFQGLSQLYGGDGFFVEEDGYLYVYNGGYYPGEENTSFETYWQAVQLTGEKGDSYYIYTAYCEENISGSILYFDSPKKYIGIATSSSQLDSETLNKWETYKWTRWQGEDGWGQEQIFLLTSNALGYDPNGDHLPIPDNNDKTTPEYLPTHGYGANAYPNDKWSDTPLDVSETYPYCWVVTRKGQGNDFGDWIGYEISGTYYAALYSRYSYDGINNVYVDLSNDLAVIPSEDGIIDPDFTDDVTTTVRVYVGNELVPYWNDSTNVANYTITVNSNYASLSNNVLTLNKNAIEGLKQIPIAVTINGNTYNINWKILLTENAYELEPSTSVINRYSEGERNGYLELNNISVKVWKWSENKWIASGAPVFATLTFIDGDQMILSTEGGEITMSQNVATIPLSNYQNVSGIRVYVVQKNDNGEYISNGQVLSFEDIAIVADGINGESSLHLELTNDFTMIATDSDGNVDSNWDEDVNDGENDQDLAISTANLYHGTKSVVGSYKWSIIEGNGTLRGASTDTCSLATLSSDSATIRCTATYDNVSVYKDFNVVKSKGQPVYKLVPSAHLFTYGKDGSDVVNPDVITFSVSKWNGRSYSDVSDLLAEGLKITDVNGNSISEISASRANVAVYLKKGTTTLDQEIIGFVEGGSKGSDALHLELSNDFTMVPTDSDGIPSSNWDEEDDAGQDLAISTASLFLGITPITGSYTWTIESGNGTLEDANTDTCSLLTMDTDEVTIRCTAVYDGQSISKDFNVVKSKGNPVYKLIPSASIFVQDGNTGNLNPSKITFEVQKWNGNAFSILSDISADGLTLTNSSITSPATVELKKGDVVLDRESIGLVVGGKDGVSPNASFKSTVFTRNPSPPSTPTGGSYDSPKPDDDSWEDGVPSGTDILWASTRIFSSDGKYPQEVAWTTPAQMTDTADFDVEFSSFEGNPGTPTAPISGATWSNAADDTTIWMATRKAKNNVWSDWQVSKIKGEDGNDGTSIVMKGVSSVLPEKGSVIGEGYTVDGILYVWDGDSWVDCGEVKGDPGDPGVSSYIHVKYASEVTTDANGYGITGTFTNSNGEEPGKYMGVYVDSAEDDVLDITKYKWTKAEGEDGFGYEYVYQRNNSSTAPEVPTEVTNDDVAPSGWTDAPSGVTSEEMYEWVCWRKKTGGTWSNWIGSAENRSIAALWAKYGEKGDPGEISEEDKATIAAAVTQTALNNIKESYYTKGEIDTLEQELNDAIKDGDDKAIAQASSALQTANTVNEALTSLANKFDKETGQLISTNLNENDIYNLSLAALGESAQEYLDDGAIAQESVWAKEIVGLIGTFGHIKADNITGDVISGLTVKSSKTASLTNSDFIGSFSSLTDGVGARWQLNDNGSGWLANGNISWDPAGNVQFGSGVTLSWSSIEDASGQITNIVKTTTIDGSKIATGTIEADRITATAIDEIAELTAGKITVDKLNTTGGVTGAGTINIQDNEMSVYNANSDDEILKISGTETCKIPTSISAQHHFGGGTAYDVSSDSSVLIHNTTEIDSFYYDPSYDWSFVESTSSQTASFTASCSNVTGASVTLQAWRGLVICKDGNYSSYWSPKLLDNYGSAVASTTTGNSANIYFNNYSVFYYNHGNTSLVPFATNDNPMKNAKAGEYKVYQCTVMNVINTSTYNPLTIILSWNTSNGNSFTFTPILQKTVISGGGLQFIETDEKYISFVKDGKYIIRNGNNAIGVDENGPFYIYDGKRYTLTGRSTSGYATTSSLVNVSDWGEYQ